jgi:hypothetical protein
MAAQVTDLVAPAAFAVRDQYSRLGLRERLLSLPVMVGIILSLIWRQIPSVSELGRVLEREQLLWVPPQRISQQALSARLRRLPAALFAQLWTEVQPVLAARAQERQRPIPPLLAHAQHHYPQLWAIDSTKLEAVFKKIGSLRDAPGTVLGGTVEAVLDLVTKLPVQFWIDPAPKANDGRFFAQILERLPARTLLVMDRGFRSFAFYDALTEGGHGFVTLLHAKAAWETERVLDATPTLRDQIVRVGRYRSTPCRHPLRLVEVQVNGHWQGYLTNVLDPTVLVPTEVVGLYHQCWRIEEAFLLGKRLLGLSYLWSGDANAIALQVWATWLLYAVLIDLSDAVAAELDVPLSRISLEMVYRGLYHYAVAAQNGAASDPVAYLADPRNRGLGIVKRERHRPRSNQAIGLGRA